MKWFDLPFFHSSSCDTILNFVESETKAGKVILPSLEQTFTAFDLCPFDNTNVVILGQDPYPTARPNQHAHGLSFSVLEHVKPLPRSLKNIFKELEDDLGIRREKGNLTDWAKQGILLLNTSLTVEEGKPGSHSELGWAVLTKQVLECLSSRRKNIVFVLWGNHAGMKARYIEGTDHLILTSAHPSPLSAARGFFGSKPFSKVNDYLVSVNKQPIKWG